MAEKYDFFISYVAKDKAWAEWIGWQLEEVGYATVLFPRDLDPGDNFMKKISRALRDCDRLILVVSPASLASP